MEGGFLSQAPLKGGTPGGLTSYSFCKGICQDQSWRASGTWLRPRERNTELASPPEAKVSVSGPQEEF